MLCICLNVLDSVSYEDDQDIGSLGATAAGGISDLNLSNDDNTTNGQVTIQNMRHLTRLISDMSKYTILVLFALISSFVFIILMIFVRIIVENNNYFSLLARLIESFDCLVNCICLVLQFEFSKKYYKILCAKCHTKCEDRYTERTNKQNDQKLQRLASGELGFQVNGTNANINGVNDTNVKHSEQHETDNPIAPISMIAQKSADTLHV